ncbi:MAG TPA: hypothetical protein VE422_41305 [Terriglobia bacterium]|nr:hypothetical protein [Terriglobia bacterium]
MELRKLVKVVLLFMGIATVGEIYFLKAPEWTRGFQPFLLHGQGESSGPTATFLDPPIPLIMVGSFDGGSTRYSTVIQITSTSTASVPALLSGDFFSSDGTPFPATFRSNRTANFKGTLALTTLSVGQTMVITADQDNPGLIGWGRILVNTTSRFPAGSILMSATIEARDTRTGEVIYRFPVDTTSASAGTNRFLLQRVGSAAGADVGFIIVNNSPSMASITATLRDVNGNTLMSRGIQLGPLSQIAYYVPTFFSLGPESGGPNYTNILFESESSALVAIAIASGAGPYFTLPVTRYP